MAMQPADVDLVEDVFDEALDFLSEKTGYNVDQLLPAIAVIVGRRTGKVGRLVIAVSQDLSSNRFAIRLTWLGCRLGQLLLSQQLTSTNTRVWRRPWTLCCWRSKWLAPLRLYHRHIISQIHGLLCRSAKRKERSP